MMQAARRASLTVVLLLTSLGTASAENASFGSCSYWNARARVPEVSSTAPDSGLKKLQQEDVPKAYYRLGFVAWVRLRSARPAGPRNTGSGRPLDAWGGTSP